MKTLYNVELHPLLDCDNSVAMEAREQALYLKLRKVTGIGYGLNSLLKVE